MSKTDAAMKLAAVILVWAIAIGAVVLLVWLVLAGVKTGYCTIAAGFDAHSVWCPSWYYSGISP